MKEWLEKKVRRHFDAGRNPQGFGWTRWSRHWLYDELGLFNDYRRSPPELDADRAPGSIGLITLGMKQAGKQSAGNLHALFDEARTGNVTTVEVTPSPNRKRVAGNPPPTVPAPVLDLPEWLRYSNIPESPSQRTLGGPLPLRVRGQGRRR